jgi:hypothetical protein
LLSYFLNFPQLTKGDLTMIKVNQVIGGGIVPTYIPINSIECLMHDKENNLVVIKTSVYSYRVSLENNSGLIEQLDNFVGN